MSGMGLVWLLLLLAHLVVIITSCQRSSFVNDSSYQHGKGSGQSVLTVTAGAAAWVTTTTTGGWQYKQTGAEQDRSRHPAAGQQYTEPHSGGPPTLIMDALDKVSASGVCMDARPKGLV
jgi:hypothetical protein